jgi:hypothetical protein
VIWRNKASPKCEGLSAFGLLPRALFFLKPTAHPLQFMAWRSKYFDIWTAFLMLENLLPAKGLPAHEENRVIFSIKLYYNFGGKYRRYHL